MPHVRSITHIDRIPYDVVQQIIKKAFRYRTQQCTQKLQNKIIGNLTNTTLLTTDYTRDTLFLSGASFQTAIYKANGLSVSGPSGKFTSETIETMEQYCDAIVLHNPLRIDTEKVSKWTDKPIVDGGGPTQALVSYMTICDYFKVPQQLTVTFCGDLNNCLVSRSLIRLLDKMVDKLTLYLISPEENRLEEGFVRSTKQVCVVGDDLSSVMPATDVLFMAHSANEPESTFEMAKPECIVLQPCPRIETEAFIVPRSKYFEQIQNGVYLRMAILGYCLGLKKAWI